MKEHITRIRIEDIPPQGRELHFELDLEHLNSRVGLARASSDEKEVKTPPYVFLSPPTSHMNLHLEGSTVLITGSVVGNYRTPCSRCAEDTQKRLESSINLILKPHSERSVVGSEEEDLNFGIYDGEFVDCSDIAEEFLTLAVPFTALCNEECKGLCSNCGKNLNTETCDCRKKDEGDPRLQVLRDLKLVQ